MTGTLLKSAGSLAILAAAGVLGAAIVAPSAARAADLGGDCCADLEERVAELEATTARKGNKKVSLTLTGRVHFNMMWWNDNSAGLDLANHEFDHKSDLYFGNAGANETRFILKGDAKVTSDVVAGFNMEIRNDVSSGTKHTQYTHQENPVLSGRATYVFLKSKSAGELRLGYQDSATDATFYQNLGGGTVGKLKGGTFTGPFFLRDVNGVLTNATYVSALSELGDTKENRLVYISPTLMGFTLQGDIGGDDTAGAALLYKNKFGEVSVAAGVGYKTSTRFDGAGVSAGQKVQTKTDYTDPLTDTTNDRLSVLSMSGSIMDGSSGLYVSGEYSTAYADIVGRQDATNWFAQAGWAKNVSGLGATTLYGSYGRTDNLLQNNTSAHFWNVGVDQAIDSAASAVYLHYQRNEFDSNGVSNSANTKTGAINSQSTDSVTTGMIINF